MVVYELERAMGRYVRERSTLLGSTQTAQDILNRSSNLDKQDSNSPVQLIIENSYLGEILSLSISAAQGTSEAPHLLNLEKLLLSLAIYDIRNAISHPNRNFPECYWYRCAAIASDPTIDALGFFEVSLAFQNALNGKLEEPPDNWLHKKRWSVPTILPTEFEHAITGLVGRTRDAAKLDREIKNKRSPLIALVAKGGVGKTSLLLQAMSDFCISASAAQFTDGVLWVSFKQERLTSRGIEILAAPASLANLELLLCAEASKIFGTEYVTFSEMKNQLSTKRLVLCLDNLETLLRDSPAPFNSFYEDLPEEWKVIVTSRIAVESAKNIPLDVLDKSGAISLARSYINSKSGLTVDGEILERIAIGCSFNPLAIRLTIELYLSGAEISQALQKSEKDVLAFSFTSLLDQLSTIENNVLEATFVLENPNRAEICGALDYSPDDVAESVAKLSKTSLIVRQDTEEGETYALGSSIRDLLRAHPRNLSIRSNIVDWLAKSKASTQQALKAQLERNISPVDLSYLPENIPTNLIAVSKKLLAAIRREDRIEIVNIESQLRQQLGADSSSSFLHRIYAWTVLELDDIAIAITHFQRASAIDPNDPAPSFGLALAYQSQGNREDLYRITGALIENGWGSVENSGKYYANRIWAFHLFCANVAEKYAEVFEATKNWEQTIDALPCFAVGRASAYRRQADSEYRKHECDEKRLGTFFAKASQLLLKSLISEGFAKWILHEVGKFISELKYYTNRGVKFESIKEDDLIKVSNLLRYCLSNEAFRAGISDIDIRLLLRKFENSSTQPEKNGSEDNRKKFEKEGYTFAKIKNGIRNDIAYFFVQDDRGTDYFVHLDVFEGGNWTRRTVLSPGVELAIRFDPVRTSNAYRASEAWLAN